MAIKGFLPFCSNGVVLGVLSSVNNLALVKPSRNGPWKNLFMDQCLFGERLKGLAQTISLSLAIVERHCLVVYMD